MPSLTLKFRSGGSANLFAEPPPANHIENRWTWYLGAISITFLNINHLISMGTLKWRLAECAADDLLEMMACTAACTAA